MVMKFTLISTFSVSILFILFFLLKKNKAKKVLLNFYNNLYDEIKEATDNFLESKELYFSYSQAKFWKEKYFYLYRKIKGKKYKHLNLKREKIKTINLFLKYYSLTEKYRKKFNKNFLKEEKLKYSTFFSNIEGKFLDEQQRDAVLINEDNILIIAGAGSGKTTTIVAKVQYLIDRYKVNPQDILLLSFTNKSTKDLEKRINIKNIEVKTFHKLGYEIISSVEKFKQSIFSKEQSNLFIEKQFNILIKDENYLEMLVDYFINFLKPIKSQFDFEDKGQYIQYLKDKKFKVYRRELFNKDKKTYNREIVKSMEECKIANFLFFNGIEYEYEAPYETDLANENHRQYKPDFTIFQGGERAYIEHFGISRKGNVPKFFAQKGENLRKAKKRYWKKIKWARKIHKANKTTLIETYSYEMNENILFDNLRNNLLKHGFVFKPKSFMEIWEIINKEAIDEIKEFLSLIQSFISLMKANNYFLEEIQAKNESLNNNYIKKRNLHFINLINPIYLAYENHLKNRKEIDFNDMINKATEYINEGKYSEKYVYIIIDEFQDISIGRYKLIKALKDKNSLCKLFCVGDDWQSIYRFTGSDITLFKDFEKYFGYSERLKIETTYRFFNPLIKLSSNFIQKNLTQTKKELKSYLKNKYTKFYFQYSENHDDTFALQNILENLLKNNKLDENKKIFILGRYKFDINRIKNEENNFEINYENEIIRYKANSTENQINIPFLTVHKSKGLEADIVIIINCNFGSYGFPSEITDDEVLNLLLSQADKYENGEERRLFYVAMTRAKEEVYFIADKRYKSKFILEIEKKDETIPKCPLCKSTSLIKISGERNGRKWEFLGCPNYKYGCSYREKIKK